MKDKKLCALTFTSRHAEVMKKIIETVAEGGGELGVHMYPFTLSTFYCEGGEDLDPVLPVLILICGSRNQEAARASSRSFLLSSWFTVIVAQQLQTVSAYTSKALSNNYPVIFKR